MKFWITTAAVIALAAAAVPDAAAATAARTSPGCAADAPKCWYMIFATGDAPTRQLYFANLIAPEKPDGTRRTQMIQLFEQQQDASYIVYDLDIRCATHELRVAHVYAVDVQGRLQSADGPPDWSKSDGTTAGQSIPLVCEPAVAADPEAHFVMYLGDQMRPADFVAIARRALFDGEKASP